MSLAVPLAAEFKGGPMRKVPSRAKIGDKAIQPERHGHATLVSSSDVAAASHLLKPPGKFLPREAIELHRI